MTGGNRYHSVSGGHFSQSETKRLLEKPTYLIFGQLNGMPRDVLAKEIESHGFTEAPKPITERDIKAVTLVWTSQDRLGYFEPVSYKVPCLIKSILDLDSYSDIENKKTLHKVMKMRNPAVFSRHFADSFTLHEFKYPQCDSVDSKSCPVYILRPAQVRFYSGRGILRVSSADELEEAKKFYQKTEHVSFKDVLVSEYLDEPYLFDGRKFHLRIYLLVCLAPDGIQWSVWGDDEDFAKTTTRKEEVERLPPCGKILTAGKPYVRDDYLDKEIHDSHYKSTPRALFFPTHANRISKSDGTPCEHGVLDIRDIYDQMHTICAALIDLLTEQGIRPYSESARAFDVFGLDFMVVRKLDQLTGEIVDPCVVLIEANDRVGFSTQPSPLTDKFQRNYFKWAWKRGIAPLLKNSD